MCIRDRMGAGEQQIRITYKGNAEYRPSASAETSVTVNKAKAVSYTHLIVNTLSLESNRQIKINFDGGDLSSDAGLLLIKEFVSKLGIDNLLSLIHISLLIRTTLTLIRYSMFTIKFLLIFIIRISTDMTASSF